MDLKTLIGLRPKAATSDGLRQSLSEARQRLDLVERRIGELDHDLGAVLLDGDESTLEQHVAEKARLAAEADAMRAVIAALPPRIAEAERREEERRLDDARRDAEGVAAAAAGLVPKIITLSVELAALIEQHDAAVLRIMDTNAALRAAGRDRVPLPTRRIWPGDSAGQIVSKFGPGLALPSPFGPRSADAGVATLSESIGSACARADRLKVEAA